MRHLPLDRKKYLLRQNREYGSMSKAFVRQSSVPGIQQPATIGPSGSGAILPRLVPQLTGNGLMNRLSVWGNSSSSTTPAPTTEPGSPINTDSTATTNKPATVRDRKSIDGADADPQPLQPQTTGGLWSSWWASSGGAADKAQKQTPSWYVDGLKGGRGVDLKLVKHLISLRVHLSTASLTWIEEFVHEKSGIEVLGTLLAGLVGKSGKRKALTEVESTVLFELIKCLRVLLNTEVRLHKL
jgi:diaphanous 1